MNSLPWLYANDFYEILSYFEKLGGVDRGTSTMVNFRVALFDYGLIDLEFLGSSFTWNNKREQDANI